MYLFEQSMENMFSSGPQRIILDCDSTLLYQNFSYETKEGEVHRYDMIERSVISSNFSATNFPFEFYRLGNGGIYAKDNQNMLFVVDPDREKLDLQKIVNESLAFRPLGANNRCVFFNLGESKCGLFDLDKASIVFELEGYPLTVTFGNYFYGGFQDLYIARYDETNGNLIWKYPLCENVEEELEKRNSFTGVGMNMLGLTDHLLLYYHGKEHKLLAIDNHSGKLSWEIDFMKPMNNSKFFLDERTIYYLYGSLFISIDVIAGRIIEYINERKLRADPRIIDYSKMRDGEFIHDGLIYFNQGPVGENQPNYCIGIFDPQNQETIWHYEIPVQNRHTTFGNFQVNDQYLCFTSSEGKLYIFKRNKTV